MNKHSSRLIPFVAGLIWLILSPYKGLTQVLERQVCSAYGNSYTLTGNEYLFTIGEPVVGTMTGYFPNMTLGFQQPIERVILQPYLISATANWQGTKVAVGWQSKHVANGDRFLIQKKTGMDVWQEVEQTFGIANERTYKWLDPAGNADSYYRVIQYHLDGQISYSLPVQVQGSLTASPSLSLYPNPATHRLTIEVYHEAAFIRLTVFDPLGKRLDTRTNIPTNQPIYLDLTDYPAGMYSVVLAGPGLRMSQPFQVAK